MNTRSRCKSRPNLPQKAASRSRKRSKATPDRVEAVVTPTMTKENELPKTGISGLARRRGHMYTISVQSSVFPQRCSTCAGECSHGELEQGDADRPFDP